MKILILGTRKTPEDLLLIRAAQERGHKIDCLTLKNFSFLTKNNFQILYQDKEISSLWDLVYVRGMDKNPTEALLFCQYFYQQGRRVVDQRLATERYLASKLSTAYKLVSNNLPYPLTLQIFSRRKIGLALKRAGWPVIIKDKIGKHSKNVFKFKNMTQVKNFFQSRRPSGFLIQEALPSKKYIRVLTVGHKILGAIWRQKIEDVSEKGTSAKVRSRPFALEPRLKEIIKKAIGVVNNEICGFDVIKDKKKYYIIEANRSPQFKAFSKITGLNAAQEIIKYFEETLHKKIFSDA